MAKQGDTIGPYRLIRRLGQGTFKDVWLAVRESRFIASEVALGIPFGEIEESALIKEAVLWRSVSNHPNVNKLLEVDEYDGQVIIVSDYVEGGTLAKWIELNGATPADEKRVLMMARGILAGLHHLHSQSPPVVHRDLKPANVLLRGESPLLADFGLSRAMEGSLTSHVAGTPAYMAPEMFSEEYSELSDVWAAGVILYRMVSGYLPFGRSGMSIIAMARAIENDPPRPLPESVSPTVARILERALQKRPSDRFGSAKEMMDAVDAALAPPEIRAAPTGLITIMFTDIVNSSSIKRHLRGQTQQERDALYRSEVKLPHDRVIQSTVEKYEGFTANDTGDGFLVTFANTESAVLCALELQKNLTAHSVDTPSGHLQIRIGINTGHVEYRSENYIGAAVDKAARVQAQAQAGEVLVSRETYHLVSGKLVSVSFSPPQVIELAGIGTEELYTASPIVQPQPSATSTSSSSTAPTPIQQAVNEPFESIDPDLNADAEVQPTIASPPSVPELEKQSFPERLDRFVSTVNTINAEPEIERHTFLKKCVRLLRSIPGGLRNPSPSRRAVLSLAVMAFCLLSSLTMAYYIGSLTTPKEGTAQIINGMDLITARFADLPITDSYKPDSETMEAHQLRIDGITGQINVIIWLVIVPLLIAAFASFIFGVLALVRRFLGSNEERSAASLGKDPGEPSK